MGEVAYGSKIRDLKKWYFMTKQEEIIEKLSSREWRMNSGMYEIVNKQGRSIPFTPNYAQKNLLEGMHYLNIIPKARQLGMSTLIAIWMLDYMLWNTNISCGIIDLTIGDAKKKLAKIKHAYDNLPEEIKAIIPELVTDNKEELKFKNGSGIIVGTSHRGGTLQALHISEFAPIQKNSPEKAKEIVTGALQSVDAGSFIFIESTATGGDGFFYEYSKIAEHKQKAKQHLSELDYKLFFFSWLQMPEYAITPPEDWKPETKLEKYYKTLLKEGVVLSDSQKFWYEKKYETLQEDIRQEYPTYLEEAFEVSNEGKYYVEAIAEAYKGNKVCEFEIEPQIEVNTYWDLGRNDFTAIVFTQKIGKEIRVVDYMENTGEHISYYLAELKKKGYLYGTCFLPHDAKFELLSSSKNIETQVGDAGFKTSIVPKMPVIQGISEARLLIPRIFWKKSATKKMLDRLGKYSKKWNKSTQSWGDPYHDPDGNSDCADAFRYMAVSQKEDKAESSPVDMAQSRQRRLRVAQGRRRR